MEGLVEQTKHLSTLRFVERRKEVDSIQGVSRWRAVDYWSGILKGALGVLALLVIGAFGLGGVYGFVGHGFSLVI